MISNFHIPTEPLIRESVHSIWQTDGLIAFKQERIIPKGVTEIIFNFSEEIIEASIDGKQNKLSSSFMNGFNRMPVDIALPRHQVFFGVRLHPFAIKKLFATPAIEFADALIDMTLVQPFIKSFTAQLADQKSFDERVKTFTQWILSKNIQWTAQEKLLNEFLSSDQVSEHSVSSLAASVYYSPRQLSRKLIEVTGMNTEEILLYKKYLRAVTLIHHTDLSLTQIAYQSFFSDQSHFIKSFKNFTSLTPSEYRFGKSFLKGHLYNNRREF